MKLYFYEHCPFCARARLALGLKRIPYEKAVVMEGDAETPVRLIGKKAVPILRKLDGEHMGESLDIVAYVDKIGYPKRFDGAPDARIDAWIDGAWGMALKLFVPRFTLGDFAELATPQARAAYRLREERAFGDLDALLRNSAEYIAALAPRLAELDLLLQGRDEIGISDIKLWPVLRSLSIVAGLTFPPAVRDYVERLSREGGVPLLFDQAR